MNNKVNVLTTELIGVGYQAGKVLVRVRSGSYLGISSLKYQKYESLIYFISIQIIQIIHGILIHIFIHVSSLGKRHRKSNDAI